MGGRTVLFSAIGYGTGPILFVTTSSVFIRPTMEATGWSTSEVLLSPLVTVLFTLLGPLVGRIVDRRGVRRAIMIGLVPYLILLILFATLPANRITFYALAAGIGTFGAFGYLVPYSRAVASCFDKGAGKAFAIVGVGGAGMPLFCIPLVTLAIYQIGWQAGYLVLAAFGLLGALPAALFGVQENPVHKEVADPGEASGFSALEGASPSEHSGVGCVLRTPRFWIFSLHIFFVGGAASAYGSNIQPIMLDGGLGVTLATTVTTVYIAGVTFGRLVTGVLMDLINRYWVAVCVFAVSMLAGLALAYIEYFPFALIALAALLTAAGSGAEGDIGAYFILKEYGRNDFGTLFATATVLGGVGAMIGPYLFSYIRDVSGGYRAAAYLGATLYAAGALAIIVFGALGRSEARPAFLATAESDAYD